MKKSYFVIILSFVLAAIGLSLEPSVLCVTILLLATLVGFLGIGLWLLAQLKMADIMRGK